MRNMINSRTRRKMVLLLIDISIILTVNLTMFFIMKNIIDLPDITIAIIHWIILVLFYAPRVILGVYRYSWRYANIHEYFSLIIADVSGGILFLCLQYIIYKNPVFELYYTAVIMLAMLICVLSRLTYQMLMQYKIKKITSNEKIPVAIIGTGTSGISLAQTLKNSPNARYYPYCFIDIKKEMIGNTIYGIKVYDENDNITELIKMTPVKELILAMDYIPSERKNKLFEIYSKTNLPLKIFDYQSNNSADTDVKNQIRNINIEDLLFRETVTFDAGELYEYYSDKIIMVTGGGGSIGSEICRQIASLKPKKLIILDFYENNAYEIQQWLKIEYRDELDICVEIASIREAHKIGVIFEKYKPEIVFHTAAHKHVPLMEDCCDEAVKNNVFGTYNVVNAAEKTGVKKFIAISTDKAVNPTNIMGATKRLCEMIIQSRKNSATDFLAVRFGNVLGSNGSVIPLFKNQIEKGGPITITDKRIIRYFMTVSEAVQLVMQAGVYASKSEIFVLDMGQPIKIIQLAETIIKLSGFHPYEDIDIVEIGLRPGEKLYEELLIDRKTLKKTSNNKIFIEQDGQYLTPDDIEELMAKLTKALNANDNAVVKKVMMEIVPSFHNSEDVNKKADHIYI